MTSSTISARRRWVTAWVRRGAGILTVALVVEYFVLPQLAGARAALSVLSQVSAGFLVLGLALEAASLVSYSALTRSVLPAGSSPPLWTVLRIDISALGLSHVVPGGGATASALRYRLFTLAGVPRVTVLASTAIQGIGVAVALSLVFVVGMALAFPSAHQNASFDLAAAVAAALIVAATAGTVLLVRRQQQVSAAVVRLGTRLHLRNPGAAARLMGDLATQLRTLVDDPHLLLRTLGWASANWMLDAASLWVFLRAFGATEGLRGLLVGYGLAGILALLPLMPGGLGLVEATLISVLAGFGTPHAEAVIGVITWRLAEFWLPIPLAALAYLSLRTGPLRHLGLPGRPLVPRAPDDEA
ncbi:MAG: UPF0104 family protein [Kineosporiaceae bacterium]|nr:UPF0104 family protein [Kineosporiaceae bacterium]MBK7621253.1 UPF0104 family protein [Kineosporiaceae bacterium]